MRLDPGCERGRGRERDRTARTGPILPWGFGGALVLVPLSGLIVVAIAAAAVVVAMEWFGQRRVRRLEARARTTADAEREVQAELQRVLGVLRESRIFTWDWVAADDGLRWSAGAGSLFGRAEDGAAEPLERHLERVHPEDMERVRRQVRETASGVLSAFRVEHRVRGPSQAPRWVEWQGSLVRRRGVVEGMSGTVHEITERMEILDELRETRRALSELARTTVVQEGNLVAALKRVTRVAAETLRVERAGVWTIDRARGVMENLLLYERTPDRFSNEGTLAVAQFPRFFEALAAERAIAARDAATDPRTRELGLAYLSPLGITSVLDAPVQLGGTLAGLVCIEHVGPPRDWSPGATSFAGSVADFVARSMEAQQRQLAQDRLAGAYGHLQQLIRRFDVAKEEERGFIARELHDEIGQALTAIKINLRLLRDAPDDGARTSRLDDTLGLADDVLQRVRALSLSLRPPLLDEMGLFAALRGHAETQCRRLGLELDLALSPPPQRLPGEIEMAAFRLAQEALNNVARHAGATRVTLKAAVREGRLELEVTDDGRGFHVPASLDAAHMPTSMGLLGMNERVRALGGALSLESSPGAGTRLSARLPIVEEA